MKMNIQIINTKLIEALKKVKVKGKYYTGGSTRNESMGNHVAIGASSNGVRLCNANHFAMCRIDIESHDKTVIVNKPGDIVVEIDKLVANLNGFSKDTLLDIEAGDYLEIGGPSGLAKMPLMMNHPLPAAINQIQNMSISDKVVVGKTELTTKLQILPLLVEPVVKGCKIIDIGRYKFDYDSSRENLVISTSKSATEGFSASVGIVESEGESAIVEFSGPFLDFFNSAVALNVCMRDDAPIVFYNDNELLVKAPFIEG
tara:strand:- start:591 stop:1364 length:774 start_codon:yes stop_codon:yes gene_type:complete